MSKKIFPTVTIENATNVTFSEAVNTITPMLYKTMYEYTEKNNTFIVFSNDVINSDSSIVSIEYNIDTDKFSVYDVENEEYIIDNVISSLKNIKRAARCIFVKTLARTVSKLPENISIFIIPTYIKNNPIIPCCAPSRHRRRVK